MKYPAEITSKILEGNSHLSNDDISNDIRDTNLEIQGIEKEVKGWRLIASAATGQSERRMAQFNHDAKQSGLRKRREFVEFLEKILAKREEVKI